MTIRISTDRPQRKQVADLLDQFDQILDGLSQALNESVHVASREGVRPAVKDAIIELLADSDLRNSLNRATALAPASAVSFWQRHRDKLKALKPRFSAWSSRLRFA